MTRSMLWLALLGAAGCLDLSSLEGRDLAPAGGEMGAAADLAATADLGPDSCGVPASCPAGAMFCEGFESASGGTPPVGWAFEVSNWMGNPVDPGTRATAVNAPVCRGNRAVSIHTVGGAQLARARKGNLLLPNLFYVRYYYRVPSGPSSPFQSVLFDSGTELIQLQSDPSGTPGFVLNLPHGPQQPFATTVARDRWTCVELKIKVDSSQGEVALWVDGTLVGSRQGLDTHINGTITDVLFGASTGAGEQQDIDIFYDDVALSASPIGC